MSRFFGRVAVMVLPLAIAVSNSAVCNGWKATAEARMSCCAEGTACPMHERDADGQRVDRPVTQAAADACCASSESDDAPPAPPYALAGAAPVAVMTMPAADLRPSWKATAARFASAHPHHTIARHLLFSVLLV
ncbi:MAG: hypothetical protein ACT4QD_10075 [Acidobacteriota bacterium]